MAERLPAIVITDLNFPSDDFQALMLLMHSPRIEIVGIVAETGNTWAAEVCENVLRTLDMLGATVPVTFDRQAPVADRLRYAAFCAYRRGFCSFLGAYDKSLSARVDPRSLEQRIHPSPPSEFIGHAGLKYAGDLLIVSLGPLTGIAAALRRFPDLRRQIRRIYAMAGHLPAPESRSSRADFNVWFDPCAATVCFGSGIEITLVPLSTCRSVAIDPAALSTIARLSGLGAIFSRDLIGMVSQHGLQMPLMDQLVALLVDNADIATDTLRGNIYVRRKPLQHRGQTYFRADEDGNVSFVATVEAPRAIKQLVSAVVSMSGSTACKRPLPLAAIGDQRLFTWASQRMHDRPFVHLGVSLGQRGFCASAPAPMPVATLMALHSAVVEMLLTGILQETASWPRSIPDRKEPATSDEAGGTISMMRDELCASLFALFMHADGLAVWTSQSREVLGVVMLSSPVRTRRLSLEQELGKRAARHSVLIDFALVTPRYRCRGAFRFLHDALIDWWSKTNCPGARPVTSYAFRRELRADLDRAFVALGYRPSASDGSAGPLQREPTC